MDDIVSTVLMLVGVAFWAVYKALSDQKMYSVQYDDAESDDTYIYPASAPEEVILLPIDYGDESSGGYRASTRGIKNNNPGNVKYNAKNNWLGQVGSDGIFCKFSDARYGIRVMKLLLDKYRFTYNLTTIRQLITRWSATDQDAYVAFVSRELGLQPNSVVPTTLDHDIIVAIIKFENGSQPYTSHFINEGIEWATTLT